MDVLFKQDNKWFVKGQPTTDMPRLISVVLHQDLDKGKYTVGMNDNPNKFTVFSLDDTGLTSHFTVYVYTHRDGRHTLILYEIRDPLLADKFAQDIKNRLSLNVVQGGEDLHDFDLRVDIDDQLISKLIERIKQL